MAKDYTYQVARIRALETSLFQDSTIEQLISMNDAGQIVKFLGEKGWGDQETVGDPEAMLAREEEKIWEVVSDLHIDMELLDVLSYPKSFQNLKAAVKEAVTGPSAGNCYYDDTEPDGKEACEIIKNREFDRLPEGMGKAAEEAWDVLNHTGDGQICDVIIDRACLEKMLESGRKARKAGYGVIYDYAESQAAIADIKIAVRAAKTGKSQDFLERALVSCDAVSAAGLAKAACQGEDQVREYLLDTEYREAVASLDEGPSSFERWCDDKIMDTLRSQKYETFTIGPVIAYVLARQNEIKTVRIIISGKENDLSNDEIRERVRRMYV